MFPDTYVPSRTPEGEAGLAISNALVSGRQRQLLRLIDGSRRLAQIGSMLPGREVGAELAELIQAGLVEAPARISAGPEHAKPASLPERWHEALAFMKAHASECLGIMANPVVHLLEKVRDTDSARSAVARWHMALRESRAGRSVADDRLQAVTDMLGI